MLKGILQSFLPWILFFALIGNSPSQIDLAIFVAMLSSIFFEWSGLRKGFILSWGTLAFFFFLVVTVILLKEPHVMQYIWIISNGSLALIALLSLAIRKPFTTQYAKEKTSADKWENPLFIQINFILAWVWGIIFIFCTLLSCLQLFIPTFPSLLNQVLSYAFVAFAIWFSSWFPEFYSKIKLKTVKVPNTNLLEPQIVQLAKGTSAFIRPATEADVEMIVSYKQMG